MSLMFPVLHLHLSPQPLAANLFLPMSPACSTQTLRGSWIPYPSSTFKAGFSPPLRMLGKCPCSPEKLITTPSKQCLVSALQTWLCLYQAGFVLFILPALPAHLLSRWSCSSPLLPVKDPEVHAPSASPPPPPGIRKSP